ncbi:hypothetical protein ACFSC4_21020 [Deinococcus malanensis]|uniref:hypothetical protein n=1 Tax=Deinococcus malanensis TaxID=1706855 RepID=UPI00364182BD
MKVLALATTAVVLAGSATASSTAPEFTVEVRPLYRGLAVSIVNSGLVDLLIADACPRPFLVGMATSAESRVTPEITLKEPSPCLAILRPPQSWRVGEKITTYVALGLPEETMPSTSGHKCRSNLSHKPQGRANTGPFG